MGWFRDVAILDRLLLEKSRLDPRTICIRVGDKEQITPSFMDPPLKRSLGSKTRALLYKDCVGWREWDEVRAG